MLLEFREPIVFWNITKTAFSNISNRMACLGTKWNNLILIFKCQNFKKEFLDFWYENCD